jgi:hypothetical protein
MQTATMHAPWSFDQIETQCPAQCGVEQKEVSVEQDCRNGSTDVYDASDQAQE